MFTQNFIKIFHSVQEIWSFSLFQNLNLGNASADPKWHLTISWATTCQYQCVSISMCMQSFITTVHSVRPFSLFQNLELGTASTVVKCHFAISCARFGNPSVYIMSVVMGMQKFIKIYQKVQRIGRVSLFSEFEPRQNLGLSQIWLDNLISYILSISMCMQNFITIFFTVLEIGPFSFFQNLELGKASTDK